MSKLSILLIALFFLSQKVNAQTISVAGTVMDTSQSKPVQNAVVALLLPKDSILYKFTRTDASGKFSFKNTKAGNYILMTTHPYFADILFNVELKESATALPIIALTSKSKLLEEVIVKSGSPIRIKGDTTVYTADSFKVREGANVEELLRKLPGIQVDKNGKITAMGEEVKKVLVDGEEFFGDDPGIATKNLRADVVKEVEVFDKKSDQATFTGIDDGVKNKTINLKLKDNAKHGYFGKMEASTDYNNYYNNSAMINAFKGKRKLAAYAIMSNTGQTNLDWQDQNNYGGGLGDNMTVTDDGGIMITSGGGDNNGRGGIPTNVNGGLHYSNKFNNDKESVNAGYKISQVTSPSGERDYTTSFFGDSSTFATTITNGYSNKTKQALNLTYETKIDTSNTIKFTAKGNLNNTKSNGTYNLQTVNQKSLLINSSSRSTSNVQDNSALNSNLLWQHKFKKLARTLSVNLSYNLTNSTTNGYLYSDNEYYNNGTLYQADTVDQKKKTENDNRSFNSTITYTEPLRKDLFLSFAYAFGILNNSNDRNSFSKDPFNNYTVVVDSLKNSYRFNQINNAPGISFRLVKKKYNFSIGVDYSHSHFEQNDITTSQSRNYDFNNFFPKASFFVKMKNYQNFRINYNGSTTAPSLNQLQPIIDNTNQINQYIGNPDLKQSFTHNINVNYGFYNVLKERGMWTGLWGTVTQNAFVNESTFSDFGKSVSRTVNANGNYNFNFYSNYNFKWKKPNISIWINPNISTSRNISFVIMNSILQKAVNNNQSFGINGGLRKEKEKKYNFSIDPSISWVKSSNSINPTAAANYWELNLRADGEITFLKKFRLHSDVNFEEKQKDPRFPANNKYTLWNASLKRFLYKDILEAGVSVNDILNQNRGYDRNFNNNQYTESYYTTLKRFWMMTLTWNFSKNGKPTNGF